MEEIWKDIDGYEGLYQVSNLGRFRSLPRRTRNRMGYYLSKEKILKYDSLSAGYQRVNLVDANGKTKTFSRAHRLIAKAFVPNPENKPEVNHINGIKNDNRLENLEWVTRQENSQHAHDTGLCNPALGEANGKSKLKAREALQIRALLNRGKLSMTTIGRLYGMSNGCVNRIRRGETWTHALLKDYISA